MRHSRSLSSGRRLAVVLAVAACSHSEPFATDAPDPLGPRTAALPRQLTFNSGDDRSPSVTGTTVAYSRFERGTASGECIGLLPAEGGTLAALLCPPEPSVADTFVSSWLEPSLGPDGRRVAFVWRRSARVSALSAWSYDLVVASVDSPRVPLFSQSLGRLLPGGRIMNTARGIAWTGPTALRFLAAYDSTFKVKGGGASRFTDTITVGRALVDLDLTSGAFAIVPGGDTVRAWAHDGNATWIVPDTDPLAVLALADDGTRTGAATFPYPIAGLAAVGTRLVAAVESDSAYWFEPGTARAGAIKLPGISRCVAGAGADLIVAEVERAGGDQFGAPANLWLLGLPRIQTQSR